MIAAKKTIRIDAEPDPEELARWLGPTRPLWDDLVHHVETAYEPVTRVWRFSGKTGRWFLRLIRKKRTILYLLPQEGFFLTAFVFGERATAAVLACELPESVRTALNEARAYAEGRGLRLETRRGPDLAVIKKLVAIKMAH